MCLSMLKADTWKPPNRISAVIEQARSLLIEPNPDDAVEPSIGEVFQSNKKEFAKTAKDWVKRYASGK
jgi:ubiquitin-protein ligase